MAEFHTPRVICVIQARMSSTRLPGKILLPLAGKPVLQHVVEGCKKARSLTEVVIAAPDDKASLPIQSFCEQMDVRYQVGPEDDVLERYRLAAESYSADVVVRITSDCPLIDPAIIDYCVTSYLACVPEFDYFSNCHPRTFPRGLDVEVFSREALDRAAHAALEPLDREHVTRYFYSTELFRRGALTLPRDLSSLRWTLDTADDLLMFRELFRAAAMLEVSLDFTSALAVLRQFPKIAGLNGHVEQKKET